MDMARHLVRDQLQNTLEVVAENRRMRDRIEGVPPVFPGGDQSQKIQLQCDEISQEAVSGEHNQVTAKQVLIEDLPQDVQSGNRRDSTIQLEELPQRVSVGQAHATTYFSTRTGKTYEQVMHWNEALGHASLDDMIRIS